MHFLNREQWSVIGEKNKTEKNPSIITSVIYKYKSSSVHEDGEEILDLWLKILNQ